jgi:hypothetical protein
MTTTPRTGRCEVDAIIHKATDQAGMMPGPGGLEYGEIGLNYNATDPFLVVRLHDGTYLKVPLKGLGGGTPALPSGGMVFGGVIDATTNPPPANPTLGELVLNSGTGAPAATWGLPAGTALEPAQALIYDGKDWEATGPSGGAATGPATTAGDLVVQGQAGPARLPIGTAGQVLAVDAAGTGLEWAAVPVEVARGLAPTAPKASELWLDESGRPPLLKLWDGTAWEVVAPDLPAQELLRGAAPTAPTTGALWLDEADPAAPVLKLWDGTAWASVGAAAGSSPTTTRGDLIVRGATADERLPIGKPGQALTVDAAGTGLEYNMLIEKSATAPTAPKLGEVWIDDSHPEMVIAKAWVMIPPAVTPVPFNSGVGVTQGTWYSDPNDPTKIALAAKSIMTIFMTTGGFTDFDKWTAGAGNVDATATPPDFNPKPGWVELNERPYNRLSYVDLVAGKYIGGPGSYLNLGAPHFFAGPLWIDPLDGGSPIRCEPSYFTGHDGFIDVATTLGTRGLIDAATNTYRFRLFTPSLISFSAIYGVQEILGVGPDFVAFCGPVTEFQSGQPAGQDLVKPWDLGLFAQTDGLLRMEGAGYVTFRGSLFHITSLELMAAPKLTTFDLTVGAAGLESLFLHQCPNLATVALSAQTATIAQHEARKRKAVAKALVVNDCPKVTAVDVRVGADTYLIDLKGCALPAAVVDRVLVEAAAACQSRDGYIDLTGGTNAAPTAAGTAAVATLTSRGWTVTHN